MGDANQDPRAPSRPSAAPGTDPGARLMLAYQGGDEGAFDGLVEAYSGQVYALVTRFLGPVPAREDLVQEAFLRVIRARGRYRATARFTTWLYRIVFNLCLNEKERLSRRGEVSLEAGESEGSGRRGAASDFEDEDATDPADHLARGDAVSAVRAAIAGLPESQRMALVLSKYEDLSYAEVAEVMDSTEKAIKSMVHRARENLRDRLGPFLREEVA